MSDKRKRVDWRKLDPSHEKHPAYEWYWAARSLAGQLIFASEDKGAFVAAMYERDAQKPGSGHHSNALRVMLECGAPLDDAARESLRKADEDLAEWRRQRAERKDG